MFLPFVYLNCDTTPVDRTGVNLPCHVIHVKPGCGVTMLVTVAVRALDSFRLVKRRFVPRFKLVYSVLRYKKKVNKKQGKRNLRSICWLDFTAAYHPLQDFVPWMIIKQLNISLCGSGSGKGTFKNTTRQVYSVK